MNGSRRRLLLCSAAVGLAAAGLARAPIARASGMFAGNATPAAAGRRIAFNHLHTGEQLEVTYFHAGGYVPGALADIERILRDFRTDELHTIDPQLVDTLHMVAALCGVDPVFGVISGYRSPHTNEQLRERSSGVARNSMHLQGRAIDVRLAGIDSATLADRALGLAAGGVGYYRRSDFVHLDTGAFRTWKG